MEPSFFTISACNRCRKRKARCDTGIPACSQCQSSGSSCEYTDTRSKATYARAHINHLEDQILKLEEQIQQLGETNRGELRDLPDTSRSSLDTAEDLNATDGEHTGFIRLELGGDSHFLGTSSGMHLARSVLESTRKNDVNLDRQEPQLESYRERHPTHDQDQSGEEGCLAWDDNALPSLDTVRGLIEIFFTQFQIQYCILDYEEFMNDISELYRQQEEGKSDVNEPWTRFMLNLVLSISLFLLCHDNPDSLLLAERFRMSATTQLPSVMRKKNYRTLQCLLLLLLLSIVDSRSSPVWYISGLCMRLCVDLGFHSEQTIKYSLEQNNGSAEHTEEHQQDLKRRLFWVTYTFDRSLATILGRPFFLDDENIDVQYPYQSLPETTRDQILHWFRMQRMQSEIVDRLFTYKASVVDSQHTPDLCGWKATMTTKLESWLEEARMLVDNDTHSMDWWRYWYQNATMMLHRPLPRGGSLLSPESLLDSYESAKSMVHLSFIRVHKGVLEFTWLDLHYQLMSGLTLLFLVLKSPDARRKAVADWVSFKSCTIEWQNILEKLTNRWVQMTRMKEVLVRLAQTTVEIIEGLSPRVQTKRSGSRIMHDRGYRESIIQSLGSPGSSSSGRNKTTSSPENVAHGNTGTIVGGQMVCQPVQETLRTREYRPSLVEQDDLHITPGHHQSESVSTSAWLDHANQQSGHHSASIFDDLNLSSILDGGVWSELSAFDISSQTQFGLFDQHPLPMIGAEMFGLPILGSVNGRLDPTLTESVLNFQGNLEDPSQEQ